MPEKRFDPHATMSSDERAAYGAKVLESVSTPLRPACDACKHPVTDTFYADGAYPGVHCDVCYRLVLLGLIAPDGKRK